jgi:hypothetical protein
VHVLRNTHLRIEILDAQAPESDGTRFVRGGYVWQVRDDAGRPLLAGPEWPEPRPDPFNGQGLPEVLRHSELSTGRPLTHDGERGLIPGVGTAVWETGRPRIVETAQWTTSREDGACHFCTTQRDGARACAVQRSIELRERTLVSRTRVENLGAEEWPLHWFAHPFLPIPPSADVVRWGTPFAGGVEDNPGFESTGERLRLRRRFTGKDDGHFERLVLATAAPLLARIEHADTGGVEMTTSFVPDEVYVWANGNTFSLEPYLLTTLAPGDARSWWVSYRFGE